MTFLAQNSQELDNEGTNWLWIVGGLLLALLIATLIFKTFATTARRSKGGVEAAPGEQRPGPPPLESLHRDA